MKLLGKTCVFILLLVLTCGSVASAGTLKNVETDRDYAGEIGHTLGEWTKQQLVDTVKAIFKIRQDEQEEANRLTFGTTILQIGFIAVYGWLIAFIMPDKIASLIRTTALLGCIQFLADYIYQLLY